MSSISVANDLPTRAFASTIEFKAFLEQEHAIAPGIFLKLAKKSSGIVSISSTEAVEVALCFGWIDGRANKLDDDWWTVRYTPRRSKSIWSQKNVTTVGRLIEEGRMRPAGLAAVEAAQADGRWDRAYPGSATITVPKDLADAIAAVAAASAFFESLNKSERYTALLRVQNGSPATRGKRIEALVQVLSAGKFPGDKAVEQSKKQGGVQKSTKKTSELKEVELLRRKLDTRPPPVQDQPRRGGLRLRP